MKFVLFLLIIGFSKMGFAASGQGNGGGGHICPNSVELYDLFEGRHPQIHNIPVWNNDGSSKLVFLKRAMKHLKENQPFLSIYFQRKLDQLLEIPENQLVLPIDIPDIDDDDADVPFVEEGCEYKPIANWNDRLNRLYFKKSFYLKLSEMDRAALYFHEVAYKIARDWGATNSDQVRKFVAQSFSDSKVDTQITPRGENDFMRGNLFLGCTDFSGLYRSICYSNGDVVSSSVMSIEQDSCDELSFGNDLWVIGFKTINRTEGPDFTIQRELTPRWSANKRELYLDMSWSKTVGKETEVIHGVGVLKSTFFGLTNSSNWGNGPIDCRFTHLDL